MIPEEFAASRLPESRILIVDDDVALLGALATALEVAGYAVRTLNDSCRAMEEISICRPHLIVLDVMMPSVDGWHVLHEIRSTKSTASIPVIMLTAADSDSAKCHGYELGADDYLTKPFSVRELRCRIKAVLRRVTQSEPGVEPSVIQVLSGSNGFEILTSDEVYFVEGIRNYSYIHTTDSRYLSRLTLGALDRRQMDGFRRVHRSFIVNLLHVKGYERGGRSALSLRLDDARETEIPVSRSMLSVVQKDLGIR